MTGTRIEAWLQAIHDWPGRLVRAHRYKATHKRLALPTSFLRQAGWPLELS